MAAWPRGSSALRCLRRQRRGRHADVPVPRNIARHMTAAHNLLVKPVMARQQPGRDARRARSEENTSELQSIKSIPYAEFCVKKKKSNTNLHMHHTTHRQ